MSDNYPVLVASSHLPSIVEQAVQIKEYLADEANAFGGEWLEEQQRRLDAMYSYVKSRQVRAEISQCQHWIEIRIGEWLGPAKHTGRPKDNSSPGEELSRDIHDRHKHEFRFMAEHKGIVMDIMKNHPGREITRAALIAAIEDALLVNHGALAGSERKVRGQYLCPWGEAFDRIVWHCDVCAYYWPIEREECGQCHQGKRPVKNPWLISKGLMWRTSSLPRRRSGL